MLKHVFAIGLEGYDKFLDLIYGDSQVESRKMRRLRRAVQMSKACEELGSGVKAAISNYLDAKRPKKEKEVLQQISGTSSSGGGRITIEPQRPTEITSYSARQIMPDRLLIQVMENGALIQAIHLNKGSTIHIHSGEMFSYTDVGLEVYKDGTRTPIRIENEIPLRPTPPVAPRRQDAAAQNQAAFVSGSYAMGPNTYARGNNSHAEGNNVQAYGNYSHAEGFNTFAATSVSGISAFPVYHTGQSHIPNNRAVVMQGGVPTIVLKTKDENREQPIVVGQVWQRFDFKEQKALQPPQKIVITRIEEVQVHAGWQDKKVYYYRPIHHKSISENNNMYGQETGFPLKAYGIWDNYILSEEPAEMFENDRFEDMEVLDYKPTLLSNQKFY
jgi:hypothetical protein